MPGDSVPRKNSRHTAALGVLGGGFSDSFVVLGERIFLLVFSLSVFYSVPCPPVNFSTSNSKVLVPGVLASEKIKF